MKKVLTFLAVIGIVATSAWGTSLWKQRNASGSSSEAMIFVTKSVEAMAAQSPVILRGTVSKQLGSWNTARDFDDFSKEAPFVHPGTDFEVTVTDYIRGAGSGTVVVTVPGGTYNGVSEEIRDGITIGKEYVLFVKPIKELGGKKYILATAPGTFELQGDLAIPAKLKGTDHRIPELNLESLKKAVRANRYVEPKPEPNLPEKPIPSLPGHDDLNNSGK